MNTATRIGVILLCVGMAGTMILPPLLKGSAPAPGVASGRTLEQIDSDLRTVDKELGQLLSSPMAIADPELRKETAPKIIPVLRKMMSLFAEIEQVDKEVAPVARAQRLRVATYASAFGDAEATKMLEDLAKSDSSDAVAAKSNLQLSRWLTSSTDAEAQGKILDEMTVLAKENSRHRDVVSALNYMANVGAANNGLTKRAIEVIRDNIKIDGIQQLLGQLDAQQAQLELVGKPLAFEGRTSTGGSFNLSQMKGKVVLVDFWATWCGPCIEELPNVKAVYKKYHDQGFEIVGISCDDSDKVLNDFTKKEEMPWLQLRETSQNAESNFHPLTKKYNVMGIPTMFLVDRNGIVRHVDARENLEKKVSAMLAEPVKQ